MRKAILFIAILVLLSAGCSRSPYVIVQIADAQLGFTAADRCQREGTEYVNDMTYEVECLSRAVEYVNSISPDVVIFTGDQVNQAGNVEQWEKFSELVSGISPSVKVFHLPGNHDVRSGNAKVDSSPFTSRYGSDRFIHSEKGVNLIGINTNLIKESDSLEMNQIQWLKDSMEKIEDKEISLLFGHHPFFLTDIDEPDSYFPIMKDKRRFYLDLCDSLGIDAIYAGHRHDSFDAEYAGIPVKTTTSVAFQIGKSKPSVRVIRITDGQMADELVEMFF